MSSLKDIRPIPVEVDLDKKRSLVYDFNALALVEERYGTVEEGMDALSRGSIRAIRDFLWAGLVHEDPELELGQVGSWSPSIVLSLNSKVNEALKASFPDVSEKALKNVSKAL